MAIDITNAISVIQAKESALTNTDDSTEIIKLLNAIKLTEDQVIRSYATVTDLPIASADNEGSIHYVRDTDYLYGSNGCQWNVLGQYFAGNGICISNNCIINTFSLGDYNTDALAEGTCNLYYTDAKVDTNLNQGTAANGDYLKWNGCDYEWATVPAGYTDNDVNNFLAGGTAGNIVTCGYLAGPATFTIDPAAVGDNTGTVVIAGNLQVDGTTTTINSTTLAVDDLNITLASGSANATTSDGAGITADLGSDGSATLTYSSSNDRWEMNKSLATSVIGQVSDISNHSTTDLTEGTNLYYTDARADARIAASLGDNQQLITASDNFAAGDIVVYDNGSYVKATLLGTSGFNATATDSNQLAVTGLAATVIYDQLTDRYAFFRRNNNNLYAVVAQATSTGFTLGAELEFYPEACNDFSLVIDKNANKILCAWVGGFSVRVASFEIDPATNTITMGNVATDSNTNNQAVSIGYDTDTGKFLIVYGGADVKCIAGYVDGQNIVLGTQQSITGYNNITYASIAYDKTAQRFFIVQNGDVGGRVAAVAQINGDNSINIGAWTTVPNVNTPGNPYYKTSEGKIYLPYVSTNFKASLGEVTIDNVANTLTFNTIEFAGTSDVLGLGMVYSELIDQFYFYYKKWPYAGGEEYIADVVFNNGTPSLANSIEIPNMFNYSGAQDKATVGIDRVVGVYGTGPAYLTYSTFASINSNASSWIGIAAEDIADTATGLIDLTGATNRSQTGLVKDTVYYVNPLGSLTTTPTTLGMIGKAISTTDLQIFGNAVIELSKAIDVDFTTNTPTTTSGLVLTSDGDSTYSFQQPVVTTQIADLTDVDFTTNTPTTTSGLVLTSDGDSTYSFQKVIAEKTVHGATLNGSPVSLDFISDAFNVSLTVEETEFQFANQNPDTSLLTQKLVRVENNSNPLPFFMSDPLTTSTLSYTPGSTGPSTQPDQIQVRNLRVSSNGQKLYVTNQYTNEICQFNMSTPWDLSTLTWDFNTSTGGIFTNKFEFSSDGSKLIWDEGASPNWILRTRTLNTQWDLGYFTMTALVTVDDEIVTTQFPNPHTYGWALNADGTKILVPTGNSHTDWAFYDLGTAYTPSTIWTSPFSEITSADYDSNTYLVYYARACRISADGRRIFWASESSTKTGMWYLDTPYDLQSFNPSKSDVHILDYNATSVDFSADGSLGILLGSPYSSKFTNQLVSFTSQGSKFISFPNSSKVSSDSSINIFFNKSSLYEITSLDGGATYYISQKAKNV